jgi:hypothetical protein
MKTLKNFSFAILLVTIGFFFTSAAVIPSKAEVKNSQDNVGYSFEKKESKKDAKVARLERKLSVAKTEKQKVKIQKQLDKVSDKKNDETPILSILALIFAFIFPVVGLILAIIAKKKEGGQLAKIAFILSLVFLILWVLFLVIYIAVVASTLAAVI